jgi:threonine dehydrogenase-like Zn-dependent dehydrogenase
LQNAVISVRSAWLVITHRLALDDAPNGYKTFLEKQDGRIKVILKPWGEANSGEIVPTV